MNKFFLFAMLVLSIILFGCAAEESKPPVTVLPPTAEPMTYETLRKMLNGNDEAARFQVIEQLKQDGSSDAVTILGEFFMDANVTGRLEAARALLAINTVQAQNYLRMAMSDKQLTARRQVAMQAFEAGGDKTYPFLQKLLRDENETVRLNTVQVIQFIGTAQARTLLQAALKDASPAVQQAAVDALQGLGFAPTLQP